MIYELVTSKYGEGEYIASKEHDNLCLVFHFNSEGYIMYDYKGYAEMYKNGVFIESFGDIQDKAKLTTRANGDLEFD